ncbi:MAG: DUF3267 domain-containing protein, partial [Atopobiaceae bacterium]|nr:DUF3267 domain-containing protein [Atopobiaceae bacterium]
TCSELAAQGYRRVDLSISIFWANVVAVVAFFLLFVTLVPLYHLVYPEGDFSVSGVWFFVYLVALIALIVVHELIHGLTWSRFVPGGFADIEFGIMGDSLTPYCTCKTPLQRKAYMMGALAPLVVLGIIPIAVAFCIGSVVLLFVGIFMVDGAVGDIMIVLKLLTHRSQTDDVLIFDHPTEAGCVVFER